MRRVQIVPLGRTQLYGAMVKREAEIRKRRLGTFSRIGPKQANKAKWRHVRFKGWINLKRESSGAVTAQVNSADWQLLSAFIGWVDRHFSNEVQAVTIRYQ
jgi:hypothetical protein